jgi:glycosyltransferase involved in cell wall biosynthesis
MNTVPLTIVISTKDEPEAFRLIGRICDQVRSGDEVIILDDCSHQFFCDALQFYGAIYPFLRVVSHPLDDNFGEHRNHVHAFVAEGRWMVLLDADEWVSKLFLDSIRQQIIANPGVEVFALARINTKHRGDSWQQPEINWSGEALKQYENYPDFQRRVHVRASHIRWTNRMHNVLTGGQKVMSLEGEHVSLLHHKAFYKWERMHAIYARIKGGS